MSARVEATVAKHSSLRGSAKAVLLAIARLANDDGGGVYASVATIAYQSGYSIDTAQRAFKKARDADELAIYYNRGPSGTNNYRVRADVLAKRSSEAKSHLSDTPPANCTPRRMRDKGSFFRGEQYYSDTERIRHKDKAQRSKSLGASLRASPRSKDATLRGASDNQMHCPDCGRFGGWCDCDSDLQASFDRAMRATLDAGLPGPAQVASEAALRAAYGRGDNDAPSISTDAREPVSGPNKEQQSQFKQDEELEIDRIAQADGWWGEQRSGD